MTNHESFVVKRITQTFWSEAHVITSEDDILRVLDLTTNELKKKIMISLHKNLVGKLKVRMNKI